MIERLYIENFQSHVDTEIVFAPGVNVIVGRNMSGKSALLRALRLVFYNKPEGKDFVTWDEKNAVIEVTYAGHHIKRVKGTRNIYEVDGSVFSNFGRAIPQEVLDVLGFSILQVDRNAYELNFDDPHEAPFFISETDATKGKIFSKLGEQVLSGLLLLDKSISTANAQLRKLGSEQQVLEAQVVAVTASLVEFEPLVGIEGELDACEERLSRAEAIEDELVELVGFQTMLVQVDSAIVRLTKLVDVDISDVDQQLEEAAHLSNDITELVQLRQANMQVTSLVKQLESSTKLLCTIPTARLDRAQQVLQELEDLSGVYTSLNSIRERTIVVNRHHEELQRVLDSAVANYRQLLMEAKKCPLCLRPVDEHSLDLILEELTGNDAGAVEGETRGGKG